MKLLVPFIVGLLVSTIGGFVFFIEQPASPELGATVSTLPGFVSTSTGNGITQRIANKAIVISGLDDGCLELVNSIATTTTGLPCGSGGGGGSGTVTSVAQTVPTGFTISGSPVTTTGTLAIGYDTGYGPILTASTTNWNTFYDTPSNRITAGTGLSWSGNTLNATGGGSGGGIATTSTWTAGNLVRVVDNGTVNSIATSSLGLPLFSDLHSAVTLAGEDYLSLSTQQITANAIDADNLSSSDFGSFTCNGTTCTVDSSAISNAMLANSSVSYGGISLSLGGSDATPAFNLTDATSLPIATGVSGLGTGIATFLATPSSANLDTAVTDDTGSGALVFGTSPAITSPTLSTFFGTPCTGNDFLQDISDTGAFTCVTASGGGDTTWATTTLLDGSVAQYPTVSTVDILFGGNSTSTAGFWFDRSATTTHLGNGGSGDSVIELAINSVSRWIFGADDSDSDAFVISSGSSLGTNNVIRFASDLSATFYGAIIGATGALIDFGSSILEIPNGSNPTANDPGELAHDTTDNQLILDDFVVGKAVDTIFKVTVASTSPAFTSSGLLKVPTELDGFTITAIRCSVQDGTNKVIAIEDESGNSSEDITCTTSVTSDDGSITNATYTAGEEIYIDFGATSGSVNYVSISAFGTWTRE